MGIERLPIPANRLNRRRSPMRVLTVFRPLVIAVALSAPLAQAALAGQVEQQAMTNQSAAASSFSNGGPYSDQLLAPAVGD
jgi:hypothetical protein